MIGQAHLLETIDTLIANSRFPRFCILVGPKGSGKKTICKHINEGLNAFWCYEEDNKVDTIRNAIADAYKVVSPTCYVFTDVDNMSVQAKNSLLKVTEEPPNSAYFIMTIENLSNTLETIISRATVFHMDNYTPDEIKEYASEYHLTEDELNIVKDICDTPGQVDIIQSDVQHFYDYALLTVDNIAKAPGCNVFKITNKLKLKEDSDGYDIKLFLKAFIMVCSHHIDDEKYREGIIITSNYLSQLDITGISKQSLLDMWILDIRKAWM